VRWSSDQTMSFTTVEAAVTRWYKMHTSIECCFFLELTV
jgi:hypothetical protein